MRQHQWEIREGDCRDVLRSIPDGSIHCCATSPPYMGLRDYGCDGQIGLEPTPSEYVEAMVGVFREVRRVLHDSGVLYLNLGDSYCNTDKWGGGGNNTGRHTISDDGQVPSWVVRRKRDRIPGVKPKDLQGIPWLVAFALRDDGWYLRSASPWIKGNPMCESVDDRPGTSHEYVFLFAKSKDYFYDAEATRVPATEYTPRTVGRDRNVGGRTDGFTTPVGNVATPEGGRNRRTGDWFRESIEEAVAFHRERASYLEAMLESGGMLLAGDGSPAAFLVNPQPFAGAHFAVFPPRLVEPMVKSGTSERGCCPKCGSPWGRVVERDRIPTRPGKDSKVYVKGDGDTATADAMGWNRPNVIGNRDPRRHVTETKTVGWQPGCSCPEASDPVPCRVLDPFSGSGTTGLVATGLGRDFLGIELNPEYAAMARERVSRPHAPVARPSRKRARPSGLLDLLDSVEAAR